ncbi:MAG: hypothetical protein MUC83_11295, partial [Pirellula sp.]|nr:hypothetical protein [Pirellula sp.]
WGGMARLVTIGSMRLIHIENRTQPIFEQKVDPGRIFAQRFRFRLFFVSLSEFGCPRRGGSPQGGGGKMRGDGDPSTTAIGFSCRLVRF